MNIDIKDLQDFVNKHPGVVFARTDTKVLKVAVGNPAYMVYKIDENFDEVLVYVHSQPYPALVIYNNLP